MLCLCALVGGAICYKATARDEELPAQDRESMNIQLCVQGTNCQCYQCKCNRQKQLQYTESAESPCSLQSCHQHSGGSKWCHLPQRNPRTTAERQRAARVRTPQRSLQNRFRYPTLKTNTTIFGCGRSTPNRNKRIPKTSAARTSRKPSQADHQDTEEDGEAYPPSGSSTTKACKAQESKARHEM